MTVQPPLLTIAIPTYNRADYLAMSLQQLAMAMDDITTSQLEILISDNCSTDHTEETVQRFIREGMDIRYVRNEVNIGSDANIAQSFNLARGDYVQIMGDDDLYLEGKLAEVLTLLANGEYGMICLRSYGYENDFVKEYPGKCGKVHFFEDLPSYLNAVGPLITFISACIINRKIQPEVDANVFCGSNLVQVNLVLKAITRNTRNIYITDYMLACKRNNSGGYDFSEIFVEKLFGILDSYQEEGLSTAAIDAIAKRMLISFYPFYIFRQRCGGAEVPASTMQRYKARFHGFLAYRLWIAPMLSLPRPLAVALGGIAVLIGRTANGDLRRGLYFLWNKIRRPVG